jgi:type IX secretion system PorP/SprF family membrane protein
MKEIKKFKIKIMRTVLNFSKAACICILLFTNVKTAQAQYDAMFTQYMFNEMFINPAYAGSKEAMAVTALHRQQWVNFPGRPITTTFSLHGPLQNNKMGLGLSILNEKIGVLNRNLVYLSYSYRVKLGAGHLAFGLMGGIHSQLSKLADVKTVDAGDVQFTQNTPNVITPNFGGGIYYSTKKFYTGISVPRLVDDNVMFNSDGSGTVVKSISMNPSAFHYYFTIGRMFEVTEDFKVKGQAMVKAVPNAPLQYDINVNTLIKNLVWVGASYRSAADVSAILGCQINPQFIFSYSYDFPLTKIQKYSQGSHEIALGYVFAYKGRKITSPRYF